MRVWKLNFAGELSYYGDAPEKIQEMSPRSVTAFGVALSSRYGQVNEMIAMLKFVDALHRDDRDTLRAIESIDWDSKGGSATVTMREWLPGMWREADSDSLGSLFHEHGGPWVVYVEVRGKLYCFEGPPPTEIE